MGRPLAEQPELPSADELNMLLRYDPQSGLLFWRYRDAGTFMDFGMRSTEHMANQWNSRFSGKSAGGMTGGYYRVMIDGKHHMAHRVIWKMFNGEDPVFVDHIDGDKRNNKLENLRNVTHAVNMKNKSLYANSVTGVPGVEYHERDRVWRAKVGVDGKQLQLGSFQTKDEAIACRIGAEKVLGYHENHGRSKIGVSENA